MRKFFIWFFVILLFTACGQNVGMPSSAPAASSQTIVSIGPAITEILVMLGFGDRIIAKDTESVGIDGVAEDIPLIDMMSVDAELLLTLQPDLIFATDMIIIGGVDPLALLAETGTRVIYIPVSDSIAGIKNDIEFIAYVMHHNSGAGEMAGRMAVEVLEHGITRLRHFIGAEERTEKRTVYFEVYSAPLITVGSGAFLSELLDVIGAINVFADYDGWIVVSDEQVFARDPDVILTNSPGMDDPVGEMLARPGWSELTAVREGRVFAIDADASSRPSHNIIDALWEMAEAVYPEYFE